MAIFLEIIINVIVELYLRRKKRNARPIPKIVGSVPYHPLRRWPS
jgi:hypothetical protein